MLVGGGSLLAERSEGRTGHLAHTGFDPVENRLAEVGVDQARREAGAQTAGAGGVDDGNKRSLARRIEERRSLHGSLEQLMAVREIQHNTVSESDVHDNSLVAVVRGQGRSLINNDTKNRKK